MDNSWQLRCLCPENVKWALLIPTTWRISGNTDGLFSITDAFDLNSSHVEDTAQERLFKDIFLRHTSLSYMRPVINPSTVTNVVYRMLVHELIDLVSRFWILHCPNSTFFEWLKHLQNHSFQIMYNTFQIQHFSSDWQIYKSQLSRIKLENYHIFKYITLLKLNH